MATFRSPKHKSLVVKFADRSYVRFDRGSVEVEGELADRLAAFAKRHPEYEIERAEGDDDDKALTPKQKAQLRARELGVDDSGTQKDIEARIAAAEKPSDEDETEDEDDEEDSGDQSDPEDSDDAS